MDWRGTASRLQTPWCARNASNLRNLRVCAQTTSAHCVRGQVSSPSTARPWGAGQFRAQPIGMEARNRRTVSSSLTVVAARGAGGRARSGGHLWLRRKATAIPMSSCLITSGSAPYAAPGRHHRPSNATVGGPLPSCARGEPPSVLQRSGCILTRAGWRTSSARAGSTGKLVPPSGKGWMENSRCALADGNALTS